MPAEGGRPAGAASSRGQGARALGRAASRLGAAVRTVLMVAVAACVLLLAAGLALSWRLSEGPLDVAWAARRIEAAANAPGRPTQLSIGAAFIRWSGFAEGAGQGLGLQLRDVALRDEGGAPIATVGQVDMAVSLPRLLLGEVVPRRLSVEALNLVLLRDRDGRVTLDLGGLALPDDSGEPGQQDAAGPTLRSTLAELARPPRRPGTRRVRPDLQHLEELTAVRLRDTVLHLRDATLGQAVRLDIPALEMRRNPGGGVLGTASAKATLGGAQAGLAVRAALAPDGGTEVQVTVEPLNAARVQDAAPALATADALDAAVQGNATLQLDARLHPTSLAVHLVAGGGRLRLADGLIGFDSIALDAAAAWDRAAGQPEPGADGWGIPQHLQLSQARAVVRAPGGTWPTTITAAGRLDRTAGGYSGTAEGTIDHVLFADVGALWPKRLGGHIRPWLVPNVTGGTARDGAIKAAFVTKADFSDLALTDVDATARGEDVTIWWLRPVPPVEQAQAVLTFKTPELMDISVSSARQGNLMLSHGLLHFTGMADKDQFLQLDGDLAGSVPDLVALLRTPALQLLSRSPIPLRNPGGAMTGHMTVNMPMKDVIAFEDVKIQTSSRTTNLHLGGLVAGRDLDRGAIQVDTTPEMLRASGPAVLGGVPADLTLSLDFRGGGPNQVVQRASAAARMSAQQLSAAGMNPGGLVQSGAGQFTARYLQRRDRSAEMQVSGDLQDAALAALGWTKAAGQAGDFSARLLLRGDSLTGVDQLRAAAPGLALDGHVEVGADQQQAVVLDRLVLGGTQASGRVVVPANAAEPVRATLSGRSLDLVAARAADRTAEPGPASPPGRKWIADLRFDQMLLVAGRPLTGVAAHAENDGRRLSALSLTTGAPEQLRAAVRPEGRGRRVALTAADAGAALRAAGLVGSVQGGTLSLDAAYDDAAAGSPLSGTAEVKDFTVRDAPALGKLLQAATIYGVVDALRGPGLRFSTLVMPFRLTDGVVQVTDGQAFSASLGLTARGRIDTGRGTLDLQGTVVPAYVFNSLLGRIPLLGRVFTNEQGGGLLAVDYALRGPLADPAVRVNPLSALTPGFLRGLFHVFD